MNRPPMQLTAKHAAEAAAKNAKRLAEYRQKRLDAAEKRRLFRAAIREACVESFNTNVKGGG